MDVTRYNADAWNRQVSQGNKWTQPVDAETIARARQGDWSIVLTNTKPIPKNWLGEVSGKDILCLAGGGGQQGPVLAAAGANVAVLDASTGQLAQDEAVAKREGLTIRTIEGDMARLDGIADASFDLIVHPVSNCFVPDVRPVWREAYRVLRPGGELLSGFCQPVQFVFDWFERQDNKRLVAAHGIPYSDETSLTPEQRKRFEETGEPFEFGHSLTDQIGGQLAAGFVLVDMYEDNWAPETGDPLAELVDCFMATRARKLA